MTASVTPIPNSLDYKPDTGNFLLATPVVANAATIPFLAGPVAPSAGILAGPTPQGMSGPYGPGSFVFTSSTPQDASYAFGPVDGAGVGGDLSQGVPGNPGGDFQDVGGKLTGQDVSNWNNTMNNNAVGVDLNNGDIQGAFDVLNSEATYLKSLLPTYTPGASLGWGLVGLAGMGLTCSPFISASGTALGTIANAASTSSNIGQAIKASAGTLFSAALLGPMVACGASVGAGLNNNNVDYAINVLGNSAINAYTRWAQSYIAMGGGPGGGTGLAVGAGSLGSQAAGPSSLASLGSAASLAAEVKGMTASLASANASGHHMNFLTGAYT